jgi:hypothetical protein
VNMKNALFVGSTNKCPTQIHSQVYIPKELLLAVSGTSVICVKLQFHAFRQESGLGQLLNCTVQNKHGFSIETCKIKTEHNSHIPKIQVFFFLQILLST